MSVESDLVAVVSGHAPVLTMELTGSVLAAHLGWDEYEIMDVSLLSDGKYHLTMVRKDFEDED